MILTVTLNPSLDISYPIDNLNIDGVTRVDKAIKTAGGKGLNVSKVLHQLKAPVITTGFIGGHFGNYIKEQLEDIGLSHNYLTIDGQTRACIAILHDQGKQTEILESGPTISDTDSQSFLKHFEELSQEASVITLSGSLPKGLKEDYYSHLIKIGSDLNKKVMLDSSGNALKTALASNHKPYLIKPNEKEVEVIIDQKLDLSNLEDLKAKLSLPELNGIEWVVISLGKDGAIAKHGNTFYRVTIPSVEVVNPVGSGDATIAGFAKAVYDQADDLTLLKTGMTTGILNTMSEKTGDIDPSRFEEIFNQVEVVEI